MNLHPYNLARAESLIPAGSIDYPRRPFWQTVFFTAMETRDFGKRLDDETKRPPASAPFREAVARTEAVLFLSRDPIPSRRLAQVAELPEGTRVRHVVRSLNQSYDEQHSAFRIVEVAGGFQIRTRPAFAPWLFRLQEVPVEVRLSMPAMETLSVVAYKQPVLRAEIESVRGVQCGEMIRQLLDLDLIRIVGRSEELGRPFLYGTTRRFLQVFGLKTLGELTGGPAGVNST